MRSIRGGASHFQPVPVQTYAFEYGGNESENAAKMLSAMADKQNHMNNTLSGGSSWRRNRIKRGGSSGVIEIPQFTIPGPKVSDQNPNSSSLQLNSLLINASNDALNDTKIGQAGGRRLRKTKKYRSKTTRRNHKSGCKCKYHRRVTKHKKSKSRRHRR